MTVRKWKARSHSIAYGCTKPNTTRHLALTWRRYALVLNLYSKEH